MKIIIKKARALAAIHHKYDEALELLELTFGPHPQNIDALILMSNILDLKAARLADSPGNNKKQVQNLRQMVKIRSLEALKINPENPAIHIDLGDFYSNNNKRKALQHYNQAISLLKEGKFYISLKDELKDAREGKKAISIE